MSASEGKADVLVTSFFTDQAAFLTSMRRYDSYVFDWKRLAQSLLYFVVRIALLPLGSARYKIEPRTNHQPRLGGVFFLAPFIFRKISEKSLFENAAV